MAFIPTGISPTDKLPSTIVQIKFAQGSGSSANLSRDILLIGDMTDDGYADPDAEVYELQSEDDAIHYFGARSEVHRMFRRIALNNKGVRVWGIGVTEATGSQAVGTFALSGTAVAPGSVQAWVCGQRVVAAFAKDDEAADIGAKLVTAINAISWLPVTASGTSTVTLTAVLNGTAGNDIAMRSAVTAGVGITCTDSGTTLATGSGDSDISDALDAISNQAYYYQVCARNDATNVQALVAQLNLMADPETSIDQVGIVGTIKDVATATTIVQNSNVNSARLQYVLLEKSETTPCEIAATVAALRAKCELSDWGYNFNGLALPGILPAASKTDNPTKNELRSALESGLSPLSVDKFGGVSLAASITTKSLNGTNPDYRVRQTYIVSVCDAFKAQLQSDLVASFTGKKVSADVDKVLSNTAMPKQLRAKIINWMKEYTSRPWLDPGKLADMITSIQVVKSTATLSAQFELYCAENLDHVYAIGLESSDPQ